MINNPTSKDLLRQCSVSLSSLYTEQESRSIAFQLIEHHLGFRNAEVLADKAIRPEQQEALVQLGKDLERIIAGEPLQYVLGEAEFWGLPFKVNSHVLIPRPETEELVALIFREHAAAKPEKVLDICTGSGCIAIALKHQLQHATVWALDVSTEALRVARGNAVVNGTEVEFLHVDILQATADELPGMLDIIVSNPPYVTDAEKALMKDNVLLHEPHLALFVSDKEPLLFYSAITQLSRKLLKKGGSIYFEINEQFGAEVVNLLSDQNFCQVMLHKDLSGKDRIVKAVWPG